jgi:ABC-type antimicrobial peptide transport system permease subunit
VSAAWMRARADIRARPVSLILVTILVGLIGALAIAALAGARRSDSAYDRYRAEEQIPEALVLSCPGGVPVPETDLAAVRRLPEVEASALVANAPANIRDTAGQPLFYRHEGLEGTISGFRSPADAARYRPKLLAGRLPVAADEAAVTFGDTDAPRPAIGDEVDVFLVPAADAARGRLPADPEDEVRYRVRIVGKVLLPGELSGDQGSLWVSPAFVQEHSQDAALCDAAAVQLRHGLDDSTQFLSGVYGISPGAAVVDMTAEAIFVSRSTHLDAIILRLLALFSALAGVVVLGQSLARRTSLGAIDTPILRALGMTRRQVIRAAALPALAVAAGGAIIAVSVAIAASSAFPTGAVRVAEPDPGPRIDPLAIGLGVGVIAVTTILSVVLPARFAATARGGVEGAIEYRGAEHHSRIASFVSRLPLPASAGAGARFALEPGHGRTATPVRSAVVGLSLAVALMVAAFGFSASMDHFGSTPRLWGLDFDFGAGQPFAGDRFQKQGVPLIRDDPAVMTLAVGNFQQYVSLDGPAGRSQEAAWGITTVKGGPALSTTMLEGRWPTAAGEIALGRETLAAVGLTVGDRVTVRSAGADESMTIVGVPVFPDFGFGPGLGRGVAMTMDSLREFYPAVTENLVIGDFRPGTDGQAVMSRWNDEVLTEMGAETGDIDSVGATVQATTSSRALPLQLSILFAVAAFATLVHVLLTSVRRRRRDLAILQTLGFRRGQVAATIAWQALTLAGLALLIGVPLGILLGRLGWAAFAYRLGVVSEPVISPLSVIVIPITLVVSLVVSLGPGLVARRVRPAAVLKAE